MGIRITDLASASTVGLTDTLVLVQEGDTKKCDVSQVKTLSASELVSGTLGVARLPIVPVSLGGTGSTDAVSGLSALGGQPALTSAAPASIAQGGTGATTAVAALNALGGITSAVVPSLVTAQLSAYTLLTQSEAYQNSSQVLALASGQIAAITPASIGALSTEAASGFATTTQIVGIANTAQLAAFQDSSQVQALTTSQLNAISITAGAGLVGGGPLSSSSVIALETTGVSAGTFGTSTSVGQFTVNDKGQITSATNVGISGTAGGTVVAVGASSSTLAISNSPITFSGALQLELSTTGVAAITAGSSTQSAVITVDTYGRVTALETQAISALSPTGVISGSYGHPERVAQFTVDANGVLTGATEAAIAIPAAAVSGLAASATSDTTNAGNIITGTLSSARISVLASSQISGISAAQVGAGITSAQLSAITGTGAVVLASSPTIATSTINGYTEGTVAVGTVGATATLEITNGTVLTATLTSATLCTFTMPAVGSGKSFVLYLKQPATGTPTTATFTAVAWPGAAAPVMTTILGRMDIFSFVSDGVKWYGSFIQNFEY